MTRYVQLTPESANFPSSASAQLVQTQGTNFPVSGVAFDGGSADENCYWKFTVPGYTSGNLTARIFWYADNASSGVVRFGIQIAAITANTDTQDVETDGLATAQEQNDTHLGTTGQRVHEDAITISNLDSLADGDLVFLRLYREASDTGNDTLANDAIVLMVELAYPDT